MFKLHVSIEKSISSLQIGFRSIKGLQTQNMRAGLLKCPLCRQLTTKVLRTDQGSYQGWEVYISMMD